MTEDYRVAVAVIHGMGSQGDKPQDPNAISFSADLYRGLRARMGAERFDRLVGWREIFWADVLQSRQQQYMDDALAGKARWMQTRDFVMHRLADAAAYRWEKGESAHVYRDIHGRVAAALAHLETVTGPRAPLIVLAHSLGGHILSNYIWDMQKGHATAPTPFQRLETMAGLVTFGCNVPIFTFAYAHEDVEAIRRPGNLIPPDRHLTPWWRNYNDRDDPLGMPLRHSGKGYQALHDAGELRDTWISVGGALTAWNPLSHNAYWADANLQRPVAAMIAEAMRIGPVEERVT
ncbi:hypothetical protein [Lacimonas salitolerans]|uniref:Lecithin:cholesterol acyltransferase n=1 Tax=Lacimonas salitolerans TaxID=1323750 RepID=A0ABW4EJQ7_9RHOB